MIPLAVVLLSDHQGEDKLVERLKKELGRRGFRLQTSSVPHQGGVPECDIVLLSMEADGMPALVRSLEGIWVQNWNRWYEGFKNKSRRG